MQISGILSSQVDKAYNLMFIEDFKVIVILYRTKLYIFDLNTLILCTKLLN